MKLLNADQVNIALMLLSCAVAFLIPFELILLSYAFLGPAHYLTQISWMHNRDYFTGRSWFWVFATLVSGLIIAAAAFPQWAGGPAAYAFYSAAISVAVALALVRGAARQCALGGLVFSLFMLAHGLLPGFVLGLIILLPTVIHIYVFTGSFILHGAIKNKRFWGFVSFAVFLLCGAAFFIVTPVYTVIAPSFISNNINLFEGVSKYMAEILSFGGLVDGHMMLGFLAFAYTYHYLNWFSKVNIIKWHDVSKRRLTAIITLYVSSIGLYIYDYKVGLVTLLFLSILHVILEFPLNAITFKGIGQASLSGLRRLSLKPQS